MIAKIRGTLEQKLPGEIIVDVSGVGYHVSIALGVFYRLPEVGKPVTLLVHTHVREDALQLFGFLEQVEKQVFLLLIGVSGIGPKLAITILSGIPAADLLAAVKNEDAARLISIPGVGRRLAERMIVELRDKMAALPEYPDERGAVDDSGVKRDAVSALVNLGYRRNDAEQAVREALNGGADGLETALKVALRQLSR